jgi:uncharacterized membrane protein
MSAAFLASAAAASAQTAYSISELPGPGCTATSVNAAGTVTGSCDLNGVIWQNGTPTTLGRLPGGTYSYAAYANAFGSVVGEGDLGDFRPHALLFRNGSIVNIDPSAPNSHSVFINDSGVIVANALKGFGTCNSWVAGIYVEDKSKPGTFRRTDLQPAPGGDGRVRCEFANAANQSLQVVGSMQNSLFGHLGAFWANDSKHTLTLLQPYQGDYFSTAFAINDFGQAAGESQGGFEVINRPVMWDNDVSHTPINLPMLAGDNYGTTIGINNRGEVVGWSTVATLTTVGYQFGAVHLVIWRNGAPADLQSLIDPASGWTLTQILGIGHNGQIIGAGQHNGQPAAFVLTPQ